MSEKIGISTCKPDKKQLINKSKKVFDKVFLATNYVHVRNLEYAVR